jgi:hypothetical protein
MQYTSIILARASTISGSSASSLSLLGGYTKLQTSSFVLPLPDFAFSNFVRLSFFLPSTDSAVSELSDSLMMVHQQVILKLATIDLSSQNSIEAPCT